MTDNGLGMDVYDDRFQNALAAAEYLESVRWPDGPVCPHCGESERKPYKLKSDTRKLWKCAACRKQYTVTVGTIFEGSHIPLNKWLLGFYLLCSSKKGMSAHQLHRMLGITYKSAWFMAHRIRYAMTQGPFQQRLSGTVEVDETYVGGKLRNDNRKKREAFSSREPSLRSKQAGRAMEKKVPVVALIERGGSVRAFKVPNVTAATLGDAIRRNVDREAHLRTDAFKSYTKVGWEYASHETVNHIDEYVRGDVHTNTAENFFSILKRGINGVYHHVSEEHLGRYLDEFSFRYNHLSSNGWTDAQRTEAALAQTGGKRLRYADTRG